MTGPEQRDGSPGVIGSRIRQRLDELERGPTWLARHLDRSPDLVHSWLRGRREPSLAQLRAVSAVLDRPVSWLIGEVNDPRVLVGAGNGAPAGGETRP
jgi:transcriptional regulator with XRE-family HTH domain